MNSHYNSHLQNPSGPINSSWPEPRCPNLIIQMSTISIDDVDAVIQPFSFNEVT